MRSILTLPHIPYRNEREWSEIFEVLRKETHKPRLCTLQNDVSTEKGRASLLRSKNKEVICYNMTILLDVLKEILLKKENHISKTTST